MNNELALTVYKPGDMVYFNGITLLYQATLAYDNLENKNLGMILKKIKFSAQPTDVEDCQEVIDSELVIQESTFVYTLLCKGFIIEVLDTDIRHSL